MEKEKTKGIIEAILFASGRIVSLKEFEISLELDKRLIIDAIAEMQEEYKMQNRGIEIVKVDERIYNIKQKRIS